MQKWLICLFLVIIDKINGNEFLENSMKKIIQKYREAILYIFFGVLTTLVNIVSYWIFAHVLNVDVLISTIISWIISVMFAYVTNRRWVFNSDATGTGDIVKEMISFFSYRLLSGFIDWAGMLLFVKVIGFNDMIIKILMNILVIILNYIFSKFLIFKNNKQE